ncbi:MAG: phage capsid protein [Deltaproteobacteria bacterium]|nr:MAG: phage capsid protein [Deltaproteobacteria bacterium]
MPAPFPIIPELTAIAIAYRNPKLIADDVLPRVPVGKEQFSYMLQTKAEGFTVPDTKVGRKSPPTKVEFSGVKTDSATQDYGLDDPIPDDDIKNAPPGYDPVGRAVEGLTNLIALGREVRTAALVFAQATYAAANRVALAGIDQWSDFVNSDPIDDIMVGLDACIMRPNIMVIGRAAFTKLVMHPKMIKAVRGTAADAGIVSRQAVAELFELDQIHVGEGWLNTAKKGQAAVYARVWGKHCSLIYRDKLADTQRGTTFGYTAEFGTRVSGSIPDPNIGLRGGKNVRVGESVKELVTASDLGYFIETAVA